MSADPTSTGPRDVSNLRLLAGAALREPEISDKASAIATLVEQAAALDGAPGPGRADAGPVTVDQVPADQVGRPARVRLVPPRELPRRTWGTPHGRFATLHALAHIEANAVNLALDAVHRFGDMPLRYYVDWVRVAAEELSHFEALGDRLADLGGAYGDLPCHDGLWDIAVRTAHDVAVRMALVPLVFEARGLDVTPGLIDRFEHHGDVASAEVLRIVLRDEVGHVEVGARWFAHECRRRGWDRTARFEQLVDDYSLLIVPPFNVEARVEAGFDAADLARWEERFLGSRGA